MSHTVIATKRIINVSFIASLILCMVLIGAYYGSSGENTKALIASIFPATSAGKQRCDFEALKGIICMNLDEPVMARNDTTKYHQVIYNRVPKCASTTMSRILKLHASSRNYTFLWITGYQYVITPDERISYFKLMRSVKNQRFVLTSHHYFFPFHEYANHTILYINLIREPVSWFFSAYSYFGSQSKHFMNKWWNNRSIEDCVYDLKCVKYIVNKFGAVKFLCGSSDVCNNSLSEDAVQLAKTHVNNDYLVVGITEDLHSLLAVLERLMPDMFMNLSKRARTQRRNVTKKKARKTKETEKKLFSILSFEIDLYKFVRQRFYLYKQALHV